MEHVVTHFKFPRYRRRCERFSDEGLTLKEIILGFDKRVPAWKLAGLKEKPDV